MIHLPVKYFDEVKTGEMSSRLANDTTQVKNLIANSIPQAVSYTHLDVYKRQHLYSSIWAGPISFSEKELKNKT